MVTTILKFILKLIVLILNFFLKLLLKCFQFLYGLDLYNWSWGPSSPELLSFTTCHILPNLEQI